MKSATNQRCVTLFPELRERFSDNELREADDIGVYILHEDMFMKLVSAQQANEMLMRRAASYIEELVTNAETAELAEVGLLEDAVSNEIHGLAPYLGPASRQIIERLLPRFDVNPDPWRRRRP